MRLAIACLLAVSALALAACGEDVEAKNDYVGAVNRAQADFQARFERLQSRITATSTPEQDDATLRRFREAVDDVIGDLRAIKPPEEVAGMHATLVKDVSAYGTVIDDARRRFRSDDPREVISANTEFAAAVTRTSERITSTINEINRRLQE